MGLITFMAGFAAYFMIRYRVKISQTLQEFGEFQRAKKSGTIALPGESFEDSDDFDDFEFSLDVWTDEEKKEAS